MRPITAAAISLALFCAPALAQEAATTEPMPVTGDPVAGKTAFAKCSSCHDVSATPRNRMGPYLTGVVGRPAASIDGFTFSAAMIAARDAGLVWTPEALDPFIAAPHDYVPGTKMPNVNIADETMRANVIAYLASLSPEFDPATQVNTYVPPGGAAASGASSAAPSTQPSSAP